MKSKDSAQELRGVWIVEFAKLDALKHSDVETVRAFSTRRIDKYRPPYGRVVEEFPRQCVFSASVNPGSNGYMRDEAGNRRFWPVACAVDWDEGRTVDLETLARVRDHLWGEAMTAYMAGEKWHLEGEIVTLQKAAAAERMEMSVWHDRIADFLDMRGTPADHRHDPAVPEDRTFVKITEIMERIINLEVKEQRNYGVEKEIGGALRQLGWTPKVRKLDGRCVSGFIAPAGFLKAADERLKTRTAAAIAVPGSNVTRLAKVAAVDDFDAEDEPAQPTKAELDGMLA